MVWDCIFPATWMWLSLGLPHPTPPPRAVLFHPAYCSLKCLSPHITASEWTCLLQEDQVTGRGWEKERHSALLIKHQSKGSSSPVLHHHAHNLCWRCSSKHSLTFIPLINQLINLFIDWFIWTMVRFSENPITSWDILHWASLVTSLSCIPERDHNQTRHNTDWTKYRQYYTEEIKNGHHREIRHVIIIIFIIIIIITIWHFHMCHAGVNIVSKFSLLSTFKTKVLHSVKTEK